MALVGCGDALVCLSYQPHDVLPQRGHDHFRQVATRGENRTPSAPS